jgi:glycosyltransferase 2 family protein
MGRLGGFAIQLARYAVWILPLVAIGHLIILTSALRGQAGAVAAQAPLWFLAAAIIAIIPMTLEMTRLTIWSRFLGVPTGFSGAIQIIGGTMIGNMMTPSSTGSPAIKWGLMQGKKIPAARATTLISIQMTEDIFAMGSLLTLCVVGVGAQRLAALLNSPDWQGFDATKAAPYALGLCAVFMVAGLSLYLLRRSGRFPMLYQIRRRLKIAVTRILRDWRKIFRRGKRTAILTISLAFLQWTARFSVVTAIIMGLGGKFQPLLYGGLQWVTISLAALVPTPGGVGGAEAAFLALYRPFLGGSALLAAMAAWRLLLYYWPVSLAALGIYVTKWHRRHLVK